MLHTASALASATPSRARTKKALGKPRVSNTCIPKSSTLNSERFLRFYTSARL